MVKLRMAHFNYCKLQFQFTCKRIRKLSLKNTPIWQKQLFITTILLHSFVISRFSGLDPECCDILGREYSYAIFQK